MRDAMTWETILLHEWKKELREIEALKKPNALDETRAAIIRASIRALETDRTPPKPERTVNLMSALKRSIDIDEV
jgi:hypothetical protein